ncbi:MAG: OmpW/AlkL family protein [Pontibacterium sp.]
MSATKHLAYALPVITLLASPLTLAHEAGDVIVRVGAAKVAPDASDNLGLDVKDDTQLGLTATYMLSNSLGLELLAATPFNHTITTTSGTRVGETKQLPPTLSLQYFPMASASNFQPYAGLGLNYTTFFDSKLDSGAKLEMGDSVGLAVQLGVDYKLSNDWMLNAAVWKIDIDSKVKIDGVKQGTQEIDPTVFMLSVGTKF